MAKKKTKKCSTCHKKRVLSKFHKNSATKDGLQNNCKECQIKYTQSFYANNSNYCSKRNTLRKKFTQNKIDFASYKEQLTILKDTRARA